MTKPPGIGFKEKLLHLLRILYTDGVSLCKLFKCIENFRHKRIRLRRKSYGGQAGGQSFVAALGERGLGLETKTDITDVGYMKQLPPRAA